MCGDEVERRLNDIFQVPAIWSARDGDTREIGITGTGEKVSEVP
jgi:hypothetical protein